MAAKMASELELTSFLTKFKQLCNAGLEASLLLKSKNGIASVSLEVTLGPLLESSPKANQGDAAATKRKRKRSPAYYRRQNNRRNARMSNESQNAAVEVGVHEINDDMLTSEDKEVTDDTEADITGQTDKSVSDTSSDDEVIEVDSDSLKTGTEMDLSEQLDSLIRESRRNRDIWDQLKCTEENMGIS